TYFLYCIKKEQLPFILFPLAGYTKEEVRRIAKKAELPVAAKPQSQDICFISGNGYKDFIRARVGEVPGGDIVTINGTVVGQHDGIIQYTRGQRGGLRVALGKPQYVVAVDAEHNRIVIGDKKDLRTRTLIARDINRLVDAFPQTVCAKIRYSHTEASCTVRLRDNGSAAVEFEEAQEAITPGQAVVFYDGDTVLGGGSID
ncbi:MAG: tRNA 2-thiouridine(34) synthase MnmA, partial [Candidatus Omnitrophica bacterium]|nr:tRNA 2-thiouridine(34) synthase MnmA [Candidatus Omnitrophota bacterium]